MAVKLGAEDPSTTRTVTAWVAEGLYLGAILAATIMLGVGHLLATAETARSREAARIDEEQAEARIQAQAQVEVAEAAVERVEGRINATNASIALYRALAGEMASSPLGVQAVEWNVRVPDGELVLGVMPDVRVTAPRVNGPGGPKVQKPIDDGQLIVTDHSIRFEGNLRRDEWELNRLESISRDGEAILFRLRGRKTVTGVRATGTPRINAVMALIDWAQSLPQPPVDAMSRLAEASVTAQEALEDLYDELGRHAETLIKRRAEFSTVSGQQQCSRQGRTTASGLDA